MKVMLSIKTSLPLLSSSHLHHEVQIITSCSGLCTWLIRIESQHSPVWQLLHSLLYCH